jgi:hypothetical protein
MTPVVLGERFANDEATSFSRECIGLRLGENWNKFLFGSDECTTVNCAEQGFYHSTRLSNMEEFTGAIEKLIAKQHDSVSRILCSV